MRTVLLTLIALYTESGERQDTYKGYLEVRYLERGSAELSANVKNVSHLRILFDADNICIPIRKTLADAKLINVRFLWEKSVSKCSYARVRFR